MTLEAIQPTPDARKLELARRAVTWLRNGGWVAEADAVEWMIAEFSREIKRTET